MWSHDFRVDEFLGNNLDAIDIALDDDEEDSVEVCEVEKETH